MSEPLMRASGYSLSSSVTFLMITNAGGIVGMLLAGRAADRFGAVRVSAIWFILTACGTFLLRAHLPLGVACTVVFITGIWLFSAQAMVYSATSTAYAPARRATGLGWVTGIRRTGAVIGSWLGGAGRCDRLTPRPTLPRPASDAIGKPAAPRR